MRTNPPRILKRLIMAFLLIIVGLYIAVAALMFTQQRKMIYPIAMTQPGPKIIKADGLSLLTQNIGEGKVEAYLWRTSRPAKGLIVYFHGNGSLAESGVAKMRRYHQQGYHILIPEYRGYGRSKGQPTQKGIVADSVAFVDQAHKALQPKHTIYFGRSLGGGVSCAVARQRKPDAMILESTFTSIGDMALRIGMPPFLARDPYRSRDFLKGYDGPAVISHGRQDEVIPFEHGEALASLSKRFTFVAHDGTHNRQTNTKAIESAIASLLESVAQSSAK